MELDKPSSVLGEIVSEGTPGTILAPRREYRDFSLDIVDLITDYFASGLTISRISKMEGMPSVSVIYRWLKENKEFRSKLEAARSVRAIAFEDKALTEADSAYSKDDVPQARLKYDAAIWAAEKNDPKVYGKQVKVEGGVPMQVIIKSNIPDSYYELEQKKEMVDIVEEPELEILPEALVVPTGKEINYATKEEVEKRLKELEEKGYLTNVEE